MRLNHLVILCAAGLCIPAVSGAQVIPSPFRYIETTNAISVQGGYLHASTGTMDLGPHPAPLVFARYDRHLTGPLLGEVGLGLFPSRRNIYARPGALGTPLIRLGEADLTVLFAEAGLRFRITGARTWRGLAPYTVVSGGVGTSVSRATDVEEPVLADQRFRFGPAFAAGFGLGSEFFLSNRFSIRGEVRDHFWRLTHPAPLTPTGERQNEWRHNLGFTLGGAFHF